MTRKAVAWFAFWAGVLFSAPPRSGLGAIAPHVLAVSLIALVLVIIWRSDDDKPKPPRRLKR